MKSFPRIALGTLVLLSSSCIPSYCQVSFSEQEIFVHSQAYASTLADIYSKLKPLFQKYYPTVTMTNAEANGLHFECEVTNFNFSTPVQAGSGAKHENPIQRGPKHGGILCGIYLEKGQYAGQRLLAFLPLNEGQLAEAIVDRKVYRELLLVPYSTKRDAYLWVVLSYPPDATDEFLKAFREAVKNFTKDAD